MTDLIFQKVQENVGLQANDNFDVLEPLLPTNVYVSYQSVEVNRLEVVNSLETFYNQLSLSFTYRIFIA